MACVVQPPISLSPSGSMDLTSHTYQDLPVPSCFGLMNTMSFGTILVQRAKETFCILISGNHYNPEHFIQAYIPVRHIAGLTCG